MRRFGFLEGKKASASVPARLEGCLHVSIVHVRGVAELIPIHFSQGGTFLPFFISLYSLPLPASPPSPASLPSFLVQNYIGINYMKYF